MKLKEMLAEFQAIILANPAAAEKEVVMYDCDSNAIEFSSTYDADEKIVLE
jgi:hypothetical protein